MNFQFLVGLSITCVFASLGAASETPQELIGTGTLNHQNNCYMNALFSCLYDVTPFRRAIYDDRFSTVLNEAVAYLFARKQLLLLPDISTENDLMLTVKELLPGWEFGRFQDIDEFLKRIYHHFSLNVTGMLGYSAVEVIKTIGFEEYVINEGIPIEEPILTVNLPKLESEKALNLRDLIIQSLNEGERRDFQMYRDLHPIFFETRNIHWDQEVISVQTQSHIQNVEFNVVLPVFIARRTDHKNSTSKDFRKDNVAIPDRLSLELADGSTEVFTLVAAAIYCPGHYYAVTKSYPDRIWKRYDDKRVTLVEFNEDFKEELTKKAVMVFYIKEGHSTDTHVNDDLRSWALLSMINQHFNEKIVPEIMERKFK